MASRSSPAPGQHLQGYLLLERLGAGGQGEVWKAQLPGSSHARAIKLVGIAQASEEEIGRLRKEAKALKKLNHSSVVRCHGVIEDFGENLLGIVLDFVEGDPLAKVQDDARMSRSAARDVVRHLAHALSYLHGLGLVHRDIKASNVITSPAFWEDPGSSANIVLVDFGIALSWSSRATDAEDRRLRIGTISHMAPELLGDLSLPAPRGVGPEVDVFSFGVLAWRLCSGVHPLGELPPRGATESERARFFRTGYEEARTKARAWPAEGPRDVPDELRSLLVECLAIPTEKRIASGSEIVRRLESSRGYGPPAIPRRDRPYSLDSSGSATAPAAASPPGAATPGRDGEARTTTPQEIPASADLGLDRPTVTRSRGKRAAAVACGVLALSGMAALSGRLWGFAAQDWRAALLGTSAADWTERCSRHLAAGRKAHAELACGRAHTSLTTGSDREREMSGDAPARLCELRMAMLGQKPVLPGSVGFRLAIPRPESALLDNVPGKGKPRPFTEATCVEVGTPFFWGLAPPVAFYYYVRTQDGVVGNLHAEAITGDVADSESPKECRLALQTGRIEAAKTACARAAVTRTWVEVSSSAKTLGRARLQANDVPGGMEWLIVGYHHETAEEHAVTMKAIEGACARLGAHPRDVPGRLRVVSWPWSTRDTGLHEKPSPTGTERAHRLRRGTCVITTDLAESNNRWVRTFAVVNGETVSGFVDLNALTPSDP